MPFTCLPAPTQAVNPPFARDFRFDVLRRIRACSRTPVLMLTARGDTHDRVLGLDLGADDYLPKPYDPSELAARIRAILRRAESPPPGAAGSFPLVVDDIELTAPTRSVTRDGHLVELTAVNSICSTC
jgi:DNA-binding response OmpR family regulator